MLLCWGDYEYEKSVARVVGMVEAPKLESSSPRPTRYHLPTSDGACAA